MWKAVAFLAQKSQNISHLLEPSQTIHQQIRTTYVLKRRFAPRLNKKGMDPKPLRARHYIYDLIKDTVIEKQPNMEVILTEYVEGLGNPGERVQVRPNFAYENLLLPGLGIYASPENVKKYENVVASDRPMYSSRYAIYTINALSTRLLPVIMNKENSWTLKPWHIRTFFRRLGFVVPDEAITLPEISISGPNLNNEGKQFLITVTINNKESVRVRCRLHHWSTELADRLPFQQNYWEEPIIPLLQEQAEELKCIQEKFKIGNN